MSNKKRRLNKCINTLGFDKVLKLTGYKGATVGIYADPSNKRQIPEINLKYLETQTELCTKQKNSFIG